MKWTLENLQKEALKYETRTAFKNGSSGAYSVAQKRGILDLVCAHMPKINIIKGKDHHAFKWSFELLKVEALKHKTRTEFRHKNLGAYDAAHRLGIMDEICIHMPKRVSHKGESNPSFKWTRDKIILEAKKHKNKANFQKNASGAHKAAKRMGILNELFPIDSRILNPPRLIWTKKKLQEEALKFDERTEFAKGSPGAYDAALSKKLLDEICTHMKRSRNTSKPEEELLGILKEYFPNLSKKYFKINIPDKPHMKRFQIDIFDSKTNLGIEYDGEYHHSENFMVEHKMGIGWTEEEAKNYHQIKDDALFSCHGIKVLHIKGIDWKNNQKKCVQECLKFLTYSEGKIV